jgi:hypothetical protein
MLFGESVASAGAAAAEGCECSTAAAAPKTKKPARGRAGSIE